MDYSLNREEPRADERKAEILDCFKWLEADQETSMLAKRALRQLRELLSKGVAKSDPGRQENSSPIIAYTHPARPTSQNSYTQQGDAQSFMVTSNVQHLDSRAFYQPAQEVINPLSQYNWPGMGFTPMENLNFDLDLDESQFETLFKNIEGSQPTY